MKNLFLSLLSLAVLATSCGPNANEKKLSSSNDSLAMVVAVKDSILNQAFFDIDQIATTLDQIAQREKLVATQSSGEINTTTKSQITENINAISDLLEKNRKSLANLQATSRKLKEANVKIESLQALVVSLQSQIDNKNAELSSLNTRLAELNIQVESLTRSVENLQQDKSELETNVAQKTEEINTVYYIVGSEKELLKRNIIDKKGFIGRTAVVGANNDMNEFTKGDLRNIERIDVGGKKVKIVTSHPKESYTTVLGGQNTIDEIIITDPKAFWSNSKVLIVSHK